MSETAPKSVGLLIFEGAEELDFVGPWEVFTAAREAGAPLDVFTLGWPDSEVRCAKGLRVTADYRLTDGPQPDALLVPGGRGTRPLAKDEAFLALLRQKLDAAAWQLSVCTGSALLGRTGLLDGRRATSNRIASPFFRDSAPNAIYVDDARFVRDGSIVTSAGVSAGIDMALWLIGQWFGIDLARKVQTYIEYFPEPPYADAAVR
jgi:transcriptional regulator GlxA family with amidase domain